MSRARSGPAVRAAWSVQGKAPGQVAYDVQAGSVEPRIAQKYFWAVSTETPRADRTHAPEALPWVAFVGDAEDGRPVSAVVETSWAGGRDVTGRISYTARLLLLDWQQASPAALTWSTLYGAVLDADWPAGAGSSAAPEHIDLVPAPTDIPGLAAYLESSIGFDWAARAAALLLEGRHVVITLPPEHAGLPALKRVGVLDGICALLPYGCRAWLSAATWAGHGADHDLRLTFAQRPRGDQRHAVLRGQPAPEPTTATGRTYLSELRRLQAKKGTEALLAHLLTHRSPLGANDGNSALRHLRDLDLQAMVLSDIASGSGQLSDIARLLDGAPLDRLSGPVAARVACELARRALSAVGPDRDEARRLLLGHWSSAVSGALADDLNSRPGEGYAEKHVHALLSLAEAARGRDPQARATLLATYLDGGGGGAELPESGLRARASVLQSVQGALGEGEAGYVRAVLARRPRLTLAWLDLNAERRTLDDRLLRYFLDRPDPYDDRVAPDWLRCALAFGRSLTPGVPLAKEAVDSFAGLSPKAWRTGLHLACSAGNPSVMAYLKPELLRVAGGAEGDAADREFLYDRVDLLVPRRPGGLHGGYAAWADLCQLPLNDWDMPRSRMLDGEGRAALDYAKVLRTQFPGLAIPEEVLAAALVGGRLDQVPYPVLWELTQPMGKSARCAGPEFEAPLLDRIAELLKATGDWVTHGMPERWQELLRQRRDLEWLAHTEEVRRHVRTGSPEELAAAVAAASPTSRYTPGRGGTAVPFPLAVHKELRTWLHDRGRHRNAVQRLADELDQLTPSRLLGSLLYLCIGQEQFGAPMRQSVLAAEDAMVARRKAAQGILKQKVSRRQQADGYQGHPPHHGYPAHQGYAGQGQGAVNGDQGKSFFRSGWLGGRSRKQRRDEGAP